MAHCKTYCYKGFGEAKRDELWYSQAIRVGDRIECAGQGGWDPLTEEIPTNLTEEINQAFANVEHTLLHAGGKGWCQVYRVNLYLTDINEEAVTASIANLKKWMPDHQPIMTCIGVNQLGLAGMRVEVEVVAHDEEGAAKVKAETEKK